MDQQRLTERMNRARLTLELKRSVQPLIVIVIGITLSAGALFYIVEHVAQSLYAPNQTVSFGVTDASGVIGGGRQEIEFKGIQAGNIDSVELEHGRAVITAHIYKSFGTIYRNATASLVPATALQDMVINIHSRGTRNAGMATPQTPLSPSQTNVSVEVEDVLNAFNPDVREHMATVLNNLGGGLANRGYDLQDAFVRITPFVQLATRLTRQLAEQGQLTRRLVSDASMLTGQLSERDTQLRTLVQTGAQTLRTLANGAPNLGATLAQLPPTLTRVRTSFAALRSALPALNSALTNLEPAARRLPAGLLALRNLSAALRPAVTALRQPVHRLVPLAQALDPAAANLKSAVASLAPQVPAVNHVTQTVAGCMVAVEGFFQWTSSLTKFDNALGGTTGRGDFTVALDSSGSVPDPNVIQSPHSCAPGSPLGGAPATLGGFRP